LGLSSVALTGRRLLGESERFVSFVSEDNANAYLSAYWNLDYFDFVAQAVLAIHVHQQII
jgi:hypothetical protein